MVTGFAEMSSMVLRVPGNDFYGNGVFLWRRVPLVAVHC